VTVDGYKILTEHLARTADDVEAAMASAHATAEKQNGGH
jgi:hypothetical protein